MSTHDARVSHYTCDICGSAMDEGERYVVRIEVSASPEMPAITEEDLLKDHGKEIQQLLDHMDEMDVAELEDGVYRHFRFDLCGACKKAYMKDPLGGSRLT